MTKAKITKKGLEIEYGKLPDNVSKGLLIEKTLEGAEVIRAETSLLAPKRTRELALNIGVQPLFISAKMVKVAIGWTRDSWYGFFQELGTARHPAQPHLTPAFESKKGKVMRRLSRELGKEILKELKV